MLLAIFAGNLSYIGNGANMSIELVEDIVIKLFDKFNQEESISDTELFQMITEEVYKSDNEDKSNPAYITVNRTPNNLPSSVKNLYAYISNIFNLFLFLRQVNRALDDFAK